MTSHRLSPDRRLPLAPARDIRGGLAQPRDARPKPPRLEDEIRLSEALKRIQARERQLADLLEAIAETGLVADEAGEEADGGLEVEGADASPRPDEPEECPELAPVRPKPTRARGQAAPPPCDATSPQTVPPTAPVTTAAPPLPATPPTPEEPLAQRTLRATFNGAINGALAVIIGGIASAIMGPAGGLIGGSVLIGLNAAGIEWWRRSG
ncbi:MAG: hypothetical protein VKP62_09585 [Candidatus Sericytochromatia bacterium]|nr:hypothetical protein [Candidatus Sericytochromatia bacterium]